MNELLTTQDMLDIFEEQEILEATNLRDQLADAINTAKLDAAINGAIGICDGYLARRFRYPLSQAVLDRFGSTIKIHAANIARYILDANNDEVIKRYDTAMEWLKWIAKEDGIDALIPGEQAGEALAIGASIEYGGFGSFWGDRHDVEALFY